MNRQLLPLLTLVLALPLFATHRVIPVAGHLPGASGTSWTTDVTLTNAATTPQFVTLTFHPAGGAEYVRTVQLLAGETRLIDDAVNPTEFGHRSDESWIGLLDITAPGDVRATSRTFSGAGTSGGTYGSSYESVDPDALSSRGVVAGLVASSSFRTNVAFANPTTHEQQFRFEVRGREGEVRGGDAIRVPAMSTTQISLAPYAHTTDDNPAFSLSWTADDRGYAVGSVVDNKSGDPTGVGSVAIGSNRLFFPIVASTAGRENTFWTTSIAVTSDSDAAGDVTLLFTGSDGHTASRTVALAPHGTFRTDDVFTYLSLGSGSGYLSVDSSVPVIGSARVFNTTADRGTFGSAVPSQERIAKGSQLRIHGVRRDASYRLNIGIANEDRTTAATGTMRLFDDRGAEVESQRFSLAPSTSAQFSVGRTQVEVRGGEVEIEVENGVAVTAIASQIDNRSGDTSVVEVEQENERQHEAEIGITPRSATAGTPVTFTATLPGVTGATYAWSFSDGGSASGQTVSHTFANAGEYTVSVVATFAGGTTVREVEDITVLGNGGTTTGTLDFTWSPAAPKPGDVVTFTATTTGGGTVNWHFTGDIRKTGNVATFTFTAAGNYEVEAELEREGAATIRVAHTVNVGGAVQNPGGGAATSINIVATPSAPTAKQAVTFQATFDAQPASGAVVKWRFPDGSRPTGNPVTYTFASAGSYEVQAELEQQGQATLERKITITVK